MLTMQSLRDAGTAERGLVSSGQEEWKGSRARASQWHNCLDGQPRQLLTSWWSEQVILREAWLGSHCFRRNPSNLSHRSVASHFWGRRGFPAHRSHPILTQFWHSERLYHLLGKGVKKNTMAGKISVFAASLRPWVQAQWPKWRVHHCKLSRLPHSCLHMH